MTEITDANRQQAKAVAAQQAINSNFAAAGCAILAVVSAGAPARLW